MAVLLLVTLSQAVLGEQLHKDAAHHAKREHKHHEHHNKREHHKTRQHQPKTAHHADLKPHPPNHMTNMHQSAPSHVSRDKVANHHEASPVHKKAMEHQKFGHYKPVFNNGERSLDHGNIVHHARNAKPNKNTLEHRAAKTKLAEKHGKRAKPAHKAKVHKEHQRNAAHHPVAHDKKSAHIQKMAQRHLKARKDHLQKKARFSGGKVEWYYENKGKVSAAKLAKIAKAKQAKFDKKRGHDNKKKIALLKKHAAAQKSKKTSKVTKVKHQKKQAGGKQGQRNMHKTVTSAPHPKPPHHAPKPQKHANVKAPAEPRLRSLPFAAVNHARAVNKKPLSKKQSLKNDKH